MRTVQQSMALSSGMQQAFEKLVEVYLQRVNLPSRKDLLAVVEMLQRLDEKMDRLLPASDTSPRPARTRRPPVAAASESAPALAPAPTLAPEPALAIAPAAELAPAAAARKRSAKSATKKAPVRRAAKR